MFLSHITDYQSIQGIKYKVIFVFLPAEPCHGGDRVGAVHCDPAEGEYPKITLDLFHIAFLFDTFEFLFRVKVH